MRGPKETLNCRHFISLHTIPEKPNPCSENSPRTFVGVVLPTSLASVQRASGQRRRNLPRCSGSRYGLGFLRCRDILRITCYFWTVDLK